MRMQYLLWQNDSLTSTGFGSLEVALRVACRPDLWGARLYLKQALSCWAELS